MFGSEVAYILKHRGVCEAVRDALLGLGRRSRRGYGPSKRTSEQLWTHGSSTCHHSIYTRGFLGFTFCKAPSVCLSNIKQ